MDAGAAGAGDSGAPADQEAAPVEQKRQRVSPRELSWRDGFCADWKVRVGEKTYEVHAFILARVSQFFESHISIVNGQGGTGSTASPGLCGAARTSDLTDVLPIPCHAAFDTVLDFAYSMEQASCQLPADRVILLLKIADILAMDGLTDKAESLCLGVSAEVALTLLVQYGEIHIPGTSESDALGNVSAGLAELVARRFQPLSVDPTMRTLMLRLPACLVVKVLKADDLLAASEDVVVEFVSHFIDSRNEAARLAGGRAETPALADQLADCETLWGSVRWAFVSPFLFHKVLQRLQSSLPSVAMEALHERSLQLEFGEDAAKGSVQRQPIRPQHVAPPTDADIDLCLHCPPGHQKCTFFSPFVQICDLRLRLEAAFENPPGENGLLSVAICPVSKHYKARDWRTDSILCSCGVYGWAQGVEQIFTQLEVFMAGTENCIDNVLSTSEELQRYLSPDGFLFLRFSLGDGETALRTFRLSELQG